jgi:mannose/fructose/N-acetylgalactosamine-specific phosphotransferase system component IID
MSKFGRQQRMGAINASSTAGTSAGATAASIASTAASLANTGKSVVTGVLQAEAAQNAINAQKNLTSALTPGVITMGLAVLAYWLVTKK